MRIKLRHTKKLCQFLGHSVHARTGKETHLHEVKDGGIMGDTRPHGDGIHPGAGMSEGGECPTL